MVMTAYLAPAINDNRRAINKKEVFSLGTGLGHLQMGTRECQDTDDSYDRGEGRPTPEDIDTYPITMWSKHIHPAKI
eukprot:scaffold32091_cov22-Cyclotella_meneghiniana.AAC.2